jgi:hypothetical protein
VRAESDAVAAAKRSAEEQKRAREARASELQQEAEAEQQSRDTLQGLVDGQYQLTLSDRERFVRQKTLEAEREVERGLVEDGQRYVEQVKSEAAALFDANEALREHAKAQAEAQKAAEEAAKELAAPFEHAAERLQDFFGDAFGQLLSTGKVTFDTLKDIAVHFAAEAAAARVLNPVIRPVLSLVTPGASGSGSAGTAAVGGISLDDVLGGLGQMLDGGFDLSGAATNAFLDRLFRTTFFGGTGKMIGGAGLQGASGFTGASGFLGGFGGPILIGLGSTALGLLSGDRPASTIASGVLGTALSLTPLGPVGGLIGGLAGNLIGGLFGGQRNISHGEQNFILGPGGFAPTTTKAQGGGGRFLQQAATDAATVGQGVQAILSLIGPAAAFTRNVSGEIRIADKGKGLGYSVFDPATGLGLREKQAGSSGDEQLAISRAILYTLQIAAGGGALHADPVYRNILGTSGSTEEMRRLIGLARTVFKELKPQPANDLKAALDQLNASFEEAKQSAGKFGVTVSELTRPQKEAVRQFRAEYLSGIQDQIAGVTDPAGAALKQIGHAFREEISRAQSIGVTDFSSIRKLFTLQAVQAAGPLVSDLQTQAAGYEQRLDALASFRQGLALSPLSPLTPAQRLAEAQSQYENLARRARLGESAAVEQFPGAATQYLTEARSYYAGGSDYDAIFRAVQQATGSVESVQQRQLDILQKQLDALTKLADVQKQSNAALQKALDDLVRLIATYMPQQADAARQTVANVRSLTAEIAHQAARPASAAKPAVSGAFGNVANQGGGSRR